jgi:hypothetical protein
MTAEVTRHRVSWDDVDQRSVETIKPIRRLYGRVSVSHFILGCPSFVVLQVKASSELLYQPEETTVKVGQE